MTDQQPSHQGIPGAQAAYLASWKRRHDAVVLAAGQVLFSWNAVTDRIEWSGPYREVLGYERLPDDGDTASLLIHEEDRPAWRAALETTLETRTPFRRTFRLRHADGSYRTVEEHAYFVDEGADGGVELVGSLVDVTEKRLAEEQVLRSRAELADAIALANLGSFEATLDGDALRWSEEMYRIFDVAPSAGPLSFAAIQYRLVAEDRPRVVDCVRRIAETRAADEVEFRVRHRDGGIRTIVARGRRVDSASGAARLVGTVQDVTERRLAEQAIRESEERFRQLAEHSSELFWLANASFSRFLYLSPAFEKIWGVAPDPIYEDPRRFFALLHPDDRDVVARAAASTTAGKAMEVEVRAVHGVSGEHRWLWIRTFPIRNAAGQVYRVAGLCADVTEQKRLEAELREARDRALESDRLKTAFLANVSHEVRTPLNVILGFGSLIADHLADVGDHSQDAHLAAIERASRRLLTTIHGILDLARIEARDFELRPVSIDLGDLVAKELAPFAARKAGVRLVSDLSAKALVRFDEYCLRQALGHLLDNAFKFTDRGEVTVRLRSAEDGGAELDVADTGVGIDAKFLERIFASFSQEDVSNTRRFEGNGIGLTLVKRYLEKNGARIHVESEKGRGSTFRIVFPASICKIDAPVPSRRGAAGTVIPMFAAAAKPTVVVVEDDPATQALMRTVLARRYTALFATSGDELREVLALHPAAVKVVLMDLSLKGGEDGLALIRRLRSQAATQDLPIIAVTAHAFDDDRAAALEAGCDAFVPKPARPREILAEIDRVLARPPAAASLRSSSRSRRSE